MNRLILLSLLNLVSKITSEMRLKYVEKAESHVAKLFSYFNQKISFNEKKNHNCNDVSAHNMY